MTLAVAMRGFYLWELVAGQDILSCRETIMDGDLVKLCPRCGSEYQMRVESCLDRGPGGS